MNNRVQGNMISTARLLILVLSLFALSACVTQQYVDENDSPIVQNDASKNEIAMTRITLGIGYLNMGNTKQAKFNLEKAKRFAPNLVQVYTAFAHYYDTVGEPEQAIESYEKALSIKSDDADTLNNYGVFLCRQNQLEKAEQQILKAIAVPSYILVSESYENLALCHLKSEHFTKAEEYLDKSITHSPSRASSLLQMSKLQYIKADYIKSKTFVKRYEKTTRRFNADSLAFSFKLYEKLRDIKTAKNYAAMLLKMFPNTYEAKQYLLNGLVEIEVDQLASVYRMKHLVKKKKRVVKLSPGSNNMPKVIKKAKKPLTVVASPKKTETIFTPVKPTFSEKVSSEKSLAEREIVQAQKTTLDTEQAITEAILSHVNTDEKPKFNKATVDNTDSIVKSVEAESIDKDVAVDAKSPSNIQQFLVKSSTEAAKIIANKKSELNTAKKVLNSLNKEMLENIPKHVVIKGESLFSISKQYNIQMKALVKWNDLSESKKIIIGDEIYLADPNKVINE